MLQQTKSIDNLLVVGNSITIHGPCSYWWVRGGMAASALEKDYVHILQQKLKCHIDVLGFYLWEVNHYDRAETLEKFDKYSKDYQWVIIQLGENIRNMDTIKTDFRELVDYVCAKYKKSKIIVLGNFWKNEKLDKVKEDICDEERIFFVTLKDMQGKSEYQIGLNTEVVGIDGKIHKVTHPGVATHPGDKGMKEIADRIENVIKGNV